jgi:hypothetical protein
MTEVSDRAEEPMTVICEAEFGSSNESSKSRLLQSSIKTAIELESLTMLQWWRVGTVSVQGGPCVCVFLLVYPGLFGRLALCGPHGPLPALLLGAAVAGHTAGNTGHCRLCLDHYVSCWEKEKSSRS